MISRVRISSIPLNGYFYHLDMKCIRVGVVGGNDICEYPNGNKFYLPSSWMVLPVKE